MQIRKTGGELAACELAHCCVKLLTGERTERSHTRLDGETGTDERKVFLHKPAERLPNKLPPLL